MTPEEFVRGSLRDAWRDRVTSREVFRFQDEAFHGSIVVESHGMATVIWDVKAEMVGPFLGNAPPRDEKSRIVSIHGISVIKEGGKFPYTVIDWTKVLAQLGIPSHQRILAAAGPPGELVFRPPPGNH